MQNNICHNLNQYMIICIIYMIMYYVRLWLKLPRFRGLGVLTSNTRSCIRTWDLHSRRHLINSAAESPVKFQSNQTILNTYRMISIPREISQTRLKMKRVPLDSRNGEIARCYAVVQCFSKVFDIQNDQLFFFFFYQKHKSLDLTKRWNINLLVPITATVVTWSFVFGAMRTWVQYHLFGFLQIAVVFNVLYRSRRWYCRAAWFCDL